MANFNQHSDDTKAKIAAKSNANRGDQLPLNPKLKELCADLYEGLSEDESHVLDVIIINFIRKEVWNCNGQMTLEEISKLTGLSRPGAKKIQERAYGKIRKGLQDQGINKTNDVIGDDPRSSVSNKYTSGSGDND